MKLDILYNRTILLRIMMFNNIYSNSTDKEYLYVPSEGPDDDNTINE